MLNKQEIENWIRDYIADLLQVDASSIKTDLDFDSLGLDSASAVALVGDLEDWLNIELDVTIPYEFKNIASLSSELARIISEM